MWSSYSSSTATAAAMAHGGAAGAGPVRVAHHHHHHQQQPTYKNGEMTTTRGGSGSSWSCRHDHSTNEAAAGVVGVVVRPTSALELLPPEVRTRRIGGGTGRKRPRTMAQHTLASKLSLFLPPLSSCGGAVAVVTEGGPAMKRDVETVDRPLLLDPFRTRPDGGGITEIAGEGGTGKTQICLGMLVSCVCSTPLAAPRLPVEREDDHPHRHRNHPYTVRNPYCGTNKPMDNDDGGTVRHRQRYMRAIYVSMGEGGGATGGDSATNPAIVSRLNQIVTTRCAGANNIGAGVSSRPTAVRKAEAREILDRILLRRAYNVEDFEELVHVRLPELLMRSNGDGHRGTFPDFGGSGFGAGAGAGGEGEGDCGPIGLIVFDSIGGLFRHDSDEHHHHNRTGGAGRSATYLADRSIVLFRAAATLKRLSNIYRVPVVVVNQVSADFGTSNRGGGFGCGGVTPALGLSWSNCVNTRYLLTRKAVEVGVSSSHATTVDDGGGRVAAADGRAAAAATEDDERRMTTTTATVASTVPARRTGRGGAAVGDGDEGPPNHHQSRHRLGNKSSSSLRFVRRVEVLLSSSIPQSYKGEFEIGPDGARLVSRR